MRTFALDYNVRLLLFKTKHRLPYLRYGVQMLANRLGLQRQREVGGIEIAYARSVRCLPDPELKAHRASWPKLMARWWADCLQSSPSFPTPFACSCRLAGTNFITI
jgi:hypothetical protein